MRVHGPVYIKTAVNFFWGTVCVFDLNFDPLTVCFYFIKVNWKIVVACSAFGSTMPCYLVRANVNW